jgi:hypothetical protein
LVQVAWWAQDRDRTEQGQEPDKPSNRAHESRLVAFRSSRASCLGLPQIRANLSAVHQQASRSTTPSNVPAILRGVKEWGWNEFRNLDRVDRDDLESHHRL